MLCGQHWKVDLDYIHREKAQPDCQEIPGFVVLESAEGSQISVSVEILWQSSLIIRILQAQHFQEAKRGCLSSSLKEKKEKKNCIKGLNHGIIILYFAILQPL